MSLSEPATTPEPVVNTQHNTGASAANVPLGEPEIKPEEGKTTQTAAISGNTATSGRDTIIQIGDTYQKSNTDTKDSFLGEFTSLEQYIHDLPEADTKIKPAGNLIWDAVTKLQENSFILLDGFHGPALDAVAAHIGITDPFLPYTKKFICIDDFSSRLEKFTLHDFVYGLAAKLKETLLVVYLELGSVSALAMKELIALGDSSRSKAYKQVLTTNNVCCIFLTANADFVKEFTAKCNEHSLLRCNIPWLPYLLQKQFLQEECESLNKAIELLRRFEFWNYTDEFSFFKEIEYTVKTNSLRFIIEEGKDWEHKSPEERNRLKKERLAVTSPARVFEKQDDLVLSLVFLVTYFPDLTVNEFRELVDTILEGETEKVEAPAEKEPTVANIISLAPVTSLVPATATTEKPAASKGKTISLTEKWRSAPDTFLQKAGIRAFYSESIGIEIIDFEDGNFRAKCKAYLESHYFITVQKLFDKLFFEERQLFVWKENSRVFASLVNLAGYFASKDPDYYCIKLLLVSTIGINKDAEELWHYMESKFELEEFKKNSLGRVSKLIIGMLEYTRLFPKVNDFFSELIKWKQYGAVLELLSKLPSGSPIDVLNWIRYIINNGPCNTKVLALDYLVKRVLRTSAGEVLPNLNTIWSWVTRNEKIVSFDSYFGLVSIVTYLSKAIYQLPYESYGKWPSEFHLFKNGEQENEWNERVELLFKWITHKELEKRCHLMATENKDHDIEPDRVIELAGIDIVAWQAATIEELYLIIHGLQPQPDVEVPCINSMYEKVKKYFDAITIGKIREYWAGWMNHLLDDMPEEADDADGYRLFNARRDHLKKIINYYAY